NVHLDNPRNLRVLFISRDLAKTRNGGSGTYRLDLLRYLKSMGFELEYVTFNHATSSDEDWTTVPNFWEKLANVVLMPNRHRSHAAPWVGFPLPHEISLFQERVHGFNPDVIISDRAWLASLFDHLPTGKEALKVIMAHEVCYQRVDEFTKAGLEPWTRAAGLDIPTWDYALEAQHLSKAHMVLAIQEEDCFSFNRMVPSVEAIHLPMAATIY